MCCCGKPNVNGSPGYSWDGKSFGVYPARAPELAEGDVLLWDEPGRCGGLDSHSHHYRLVRRYGSLSLLVAHGGGTERIAYVSLPNVDALAALDSNARYWILGAIYHAHSDGAHKGWMDTREEYVNAFVQGRLKKRKSPGRDYHKVWIEPKAANARLEA